MITDLVDLLFGCYHRNLSFPLTAKGERRRSAAASVTGTYVVCLDCGKDFPYDWRAMKVLGAPTPEAEPAVGSTAGGFADTKAA